MLLVLKAPVHKIWEEAVTKLIFDKYFEDDQTFPMRKQLNPPDKN